MAPEKISITPEGKVYQGDRKNECDIEYTRTDAIIEKACSILKELRLQNDIIEQFKNKIK